MHCIRVVSSFKLESALKNLPGLNSTGLEVIIRLYRYLSAKTWKVLFANVVLFEVGSNLHIFLDFNAFPLIVDF